MPTTENLISEVSVELSIAEGLWRCRPWLKQFNILSFGKSAWRLSCTVGDKKDLPKLIVRDLNLPGITGAEYLKDLKGMDKYKHIHVIVLSSIKTPKEIERYKQLGAIDYFEKPGSFDNYIAVAKTIAERLL